MMLAVFGRFHSSLLIGRESAREDGSAHFGTTASGFGHNGADRPVAHHKRHVA